MVWSGARRARRRPILASLGVAAVAFASSLPGTAPATGAMAGPTPGSVLAWGANEEGELGDGVSQYVLEPEELPGLSEVTAIGSADGHELAVLKSGKVVDWGSNEYGQLGDGTTKSSDTPVEASGISEAVAVAGGYGYSLALLKDGKVMAWGENEAGALGDGTRTSSSTPVEVSGLSEVVAIAASERTELFGSTSNPYNLALLKDGKVMVWGYNNAGIGHGKMTFSDVPVEVEGLSEVVGIAAGWNHYLAVLESGKVMWWGEDEQSEFGGGTNTPQEVESISEAVSVAAGHGYSAALLKDGKMMTWGSNWEGVLGLGELGGEPRTPTEVPGLSDVTALTGSEDAIFALKRDGAALAWGGDYSGQLADDALVASPAPVPMDVPSGEVTEIAPNGFSQGLALLANGTVLSWGERREGALGDGVPEESWTAVPEAVATQDVNDVTQIAATDRFALALLGDGRVVGWGLGRYGELGNGRETSSDLPVEVSGLSEVRSVAYSTGPRPPCSRTAR